MVSTFVDIWDRGARPIDPAAALSFVSAPRNGAETLFIGQVRTDNAARPVEAITYHVYEPLFRAAVGRICADARHRWGGDLLLYVVHARGRVGVGEPSIVIAAGSPHREEAYQANRFVIDEIKKRAPVWKLEHFADGDSVWAPGVEVAS